MFCSRDTYPYGLCVQHSNNPQHPCWLVMWWGDILYPRPSDVEVYPTLEEAYLWLTEELENSQEKTFLAKAEPAEIVPYPFFPCADYARYWRVPLSKPSCVSCKKQYGEYACPEFRRRLLSLYPLERGV